MRSSRSPRALEKSDFDALSEFRYQMRRFQRFSEDAVQAEGITALQYLLLLHIKGFPGRVWATVGELAERLQAKPHGVVALISRCEALGLVERVPSTTDRRQIEVHLRTAGEEILQRLAALHRTELASLQGVFTVPVIADEAPPVTHRAMHTATHPARADRTASSTDKMPTAARKGVPS